MPQRQEAMFYKARHKSKIRSIIAGEQWEIVRNPYGNVITARGSNHLIQDPPEHEAHTQKKKKSKHLFLLKQSGDP